MAKVITEINSPIMLATSFWGHLFAFMIVIMSKWYFSIPMIIIAILMTLKGIFPLREVEI